MLSDGLEGFSKRIALEFRALKSREVECPVPVGGFLSAYGNPPRFMHLGGEFLENGELIPFSDEYTDAVKFAPKLAVYGSSEKLKGIASGVGSPPNIINFKGRYLSLGNSAKSSADLLTWSSVSGASNSASRGAVDASGDHVVIGGGQNNPLLFSPNGQTFSAVGGLFSAGFQNPNTIKFGNASWVALASLNAVAGELAYIKSADPTGVWSIRSVSGVGISKVTGLAFGNGVFVATGEASYVSSGIAFSSDPAGGWVKVPNPSGKTGGVRSVTFSGQNFVCISDGSVFTSLDGTDWTRRAGPITALNPANSVFSSLSGHTLSGDLFSDGKGMVGYVVNNPASGGMRLALVRFSLDHGLTWQTAQFFAGSVAVSNASWGCWAGDKLLVGLNGDQPVLDLGAVPFEKPDYIGLGYVLAPGEFVRVR